MTVSGILTAMVTPFDSDGALAEESTARLVRHLLANGSDGLVLTGTTGEASTLSDDEKARIWDIGIEVSRAERPDAPVIAGTGSNDTRHAVELTARAAAAGVDAALVVAPYYNRPNRRGLLAHFQAVAGSTDLPIVAYNIPARTGVDMPNDLLAELAQIENVVAVKQARADDLAPIDGLDLLAGNDDMLGAVLDLGGAGGILVASHLVAAEMRRMVDEPTERHAIEERLAPLYDALAVAPACVSVKAALNLLGHDVGGVRLPMVEASADELDKIRSGLEKVGGLAPPGPPGAPGRSAGNQSAGRERV
ncbi:MAG TPA: 4-hydroxy-tetrahydrodipicolinate synthase [Thermoleophilaceae bacterium]|nr:4-hydroxy-tetrahydrodipicolinate synthase [Thermoleophilaceae bacterium]